MAYLIDTGFWYAMIDKTDVHHSKVVKASEQLHQTIVLPLPAITETAYLVRRNLGVEHLAKIAERLSVTTFQVEIPAVQDYKRMAEILRKYNDANIDFVDACIVAMAERLNITKILTVDRRHFRLFKPAHCESFEILP